MTLIEGLACVKLRWFAFLVVLLAGCSSKQDYRNPDWNPEVPVKRAMQWMPITEKAGAAWGVSPQLITAMIAVESGGNPNLVSKSNAVGLMQLKASTAGREVYRHMGWSGQPSTSELKNPERNISMGAAYLSILEHGALAGIRDPKVMQYALVVSYVNGAGALLRTFSSDRSEAIEEINDLSADAFMKHVSENHPAPQAPRYIWKVQKAMDAM
ncbi:lytic murein transglycosylase [Kosakonia sacchari]|nr:membrane-bound lytic murein transglycosylase EmtA [Kosakonia sacchari]ANR77071.1 lytic murein transglycosylase [Kosakonia sacchari]